MEYVLLVAAVIWLVDKLIDRLEIPFAAWRAKRWRPYTQLSEHEKAQVLRRMRRAASKPPPIGKQFWEEL